MASFLQVKSKATDAYLQTKAVQLEELTQHSFSVASWRETLSPLSDVCVYIYIRIHGYITMYLSFGWILDIIAGIWNSWPLRFLLECALAGHLESYILLQLALSLDMFLRACADAGFTPGPLNLRA